MHYVALFATQGDRWANIFAAQIKIGAILLIIIIIIIIIDQNEATAWPVGGVFGTFDDHIC
eukprot:SAG22_NODE_12421_length_443_cov_1.168605_2_plen_61_part_00